MELTFSAPPATRLRQLLVLLLLAVALLAGVSVSQSRDVEARIVHTEVVTLPAVLQLHELANRIDDQRGMAAFTVADLGDELPRIVVAAQFMARILRSLQKSLQLAKFFRAQRPVGLGIKQRFGLGQKAGGAIGAKAKP